MGVVQTKTLPGQIGHFRQRREERPLGPFDQVLDVAFLVPFGNVAEAAVEQVPTLQLDELPVQPPVSGKKYSASPPIFIPWSKPWTGSSNTANQR